MSIFDVHKTMSCVPGRREVIQVTSKEFSRIPKEVIHQASVIIVDGRMIKSRNGPLEKTNLEGSFFVWDEREEKMTVNYVVTTQGWSGRKVTECETEKQVWDAIGSASFGALYEVSSPTGLCCNQFIPF